MHVKNIKKIIAIAAIAVIVIIIWGIFVKKEEVMDNIETGEEKSVENIDIFKDYYDKAKEKVNSLTLEEKIGQLFLVRYPNENANDILKEYKFAGYLFFEKDFKEKTQEQVKKEIEELQKNANIPLFIAADEEGGKVVRVSSNQNLANEEFKSASELYNIGGFEKIKEDTIEKSKVLYNLRNKFKFSTCC